MARRQQEDPKAEMTPMIDVVFQLMIFFIVTIKQEDIFSKLNASAPSPNPNQSQTVEEKETPIEIQIGQDKRGVLFNRSYVTFAALDQYVKEQATLSTAPRSTSMSRNRPPCRRRPPCTSNARLIRRTAISCAYLTSATNIR